MRYAMAMLMLGLGLSAVMPAAFAAERDGRDLSLSIMTAQAEQSEPGTIASPSMNQNRLDDDGHGRKDP